MSSSADGDARRGCVPRRHAPRHDAPPLPPPGGPVVLSWSGGKDSAMALASLQQDPTIEVVGLLTTLSQEHGRISHHGVRESLLDAQAAAIGLPVHKLQYMPLPGQDDSATMTAFEQSMATTLRSLYADGVRHIAFGDIFLADLRRYREERLAEVGMGALFPLWGRDTGDLLQSFRDQGFGAVVTCCEPVAEPLLGAELGCASVEQSWPDGVDPCGEYGEYHSFVHRGPVFRHPIAFLRGETVVRAGRHYLDLLPMPHGCP